MMGLSGIMAVFAAYMAAYAEELMPDRCLVGFDHYEPELGWLFLTLPLYILLSAVFAVLWREGPEMGRGAAITTAALTFVAIGWGYLSITSLWTC